MKPPVNWIVFICVCSTAFGGALGRQLGDVVIGATLAALVSACFSLWYLRCRPTRSVDARKVDPIWRRYLALATSCTAAAVAASSHAEPLRSWVPMPTESVAIFLLAGFGYSFFAFFSYLRERK